MLKKTKVTAINLVEIFCDKCGGEMHREGLCFSINPPKFEYKCKCGNSVITTILYPYYEHEYGESRYVNVPVH